MEKEDIIALALQVGQGIRNSAEMEAYEKAADAYAADTGLQSKIREYTVQQEALAQESAKESPDELITKVLSERLSDLYEDITHSDVFEEYSKTQDAVRALMDEVNRIIAQQVTGEEGSSCTGNCASCGGCH